MADDWGNDDGPSGERDSRLGSGAGQPGPELPAGLPFDPRQLAFAKQPKPSRPAGAGRGGNGRGGGGPKGKDEPVELSGEARPAGPGSQREPATIRLEADGFTLEVGGARPIRAGYRDLSMIAVNQAIALLVIGDGPDAMRWMLERFGDKIGPLVRDLRERRLRQRMTDALVQLDDDPAELVEFEWAPAADAARSGVAQLLVHPWGFVLAPIDERQAWIWYRRGLIATAKSGAAGAVSIDGPAGHLELHGLGAASTRWAERLQRLRDGAFDDASRFVEQLLPDAPFAVRDRANELLVDGRPVRPEELGAAWETVETAVLTEPGFAESYRALVAAAGPGAPRWLAMSPEDPGGDAPKIWFLVALPGNLVAMELVSEGAHATYFFRVMPRAAYAGEGPDALGPAADETVRAISEALVDSRFLREPMALPADQLRLPKYLRYRLALAALPTLAEARRRFVARVVHSSADRWNAAVKDLVAWHATARDEAAEWPGRASQESQVLAASGDGADEDDAAATATDSNPSEPTQPAGSPG